MLLVLLGAIGALAGAYLGGQAAGVCVIPPSDPPGPATCETEVRLSVLGAAIGALIGLLVSVLLRSLQQRRGD